MQKDSMFTPAAGDRADAPDVAIVVWDGIPTSDWQQTIDYAIDARQRGIRIVGFGVGSDVQPFGLSTITSWPASETVFVAASSSQLPALRDRIVNATCNGQSVICVKRYNDETPPTPPGKRARQLCEEYLCVISVSGERR